MTYVMCAVCFAAGAAVAPLAKAAKRLRNRLRKEWRVCQTLLNPERYYSVLLVERSSYQDAETTMLAAMRSFAPRTGRVPDGAVFHFEGDQSTVCDLTFVRRKTLKDKQQ
ncbi:MAG: hypothetical protein J6K25_10480 [Thermoguttaceae bacterium]|nr:hypothetical protein [Thermoguttaceae bacterium]